MNESKDLQSKAHKFEINTKSIAQANELAVKTAPVPLSIGVDSLTVTAPRPDLAGLRVKSPASPAVYMIDPDGFRRWIPDPETYNNLFRSWDGIIVDINIVQIAEASPITSGAILSMPDNSGAVFLVSNGMKRWITSPAAMDKYNFNWGRIYKVPHVLLDSIQNGANWS